MSTTVVYSLLFAPNVLILMTIISAGLWLLRWRRTAVCFLIGGMLWVLLWSLPITTVMAGGYLEKRYERLEPDAYSQADAIVVLGGHIQGNRHNWFEEYDRNKVVSRESMAALLYQAGRSDLILLSGGALEGPISDTANMARSLQSMGIPPEAIVQETRSQNTLENARLTDETLRSLERQRILLVTSALHMPRAMSAFAGRPMEITAAPLPPQIIWPADRNKSIFAPDLHTLLASQTIIKEYAGLILYWIRALI